MKNKILRFLKKWWWKTLIFILCHFLGIALLYFADFEKFREFFINFGIVGNLMCLGYLLIWLVLTLLLISFIDFLIEYISSKIKRKVK
ncbi:hypothetical protein [Spiroplasma endosymbiont of Ammophila pubescens]|uniref:hypothetical protein n=1 Tax=Spiroplasma endosymbiont of Ammophila pubescens TaxID=3066315 RepID=UPI0032B12BA9